MNNHKIEIMKKIFLLVAFFAIQPMNKGYALGKVLDEPATTTTTIDSQVHGIEGVSQANMKIVTNHPDIVLKLKRCKMSGKTCVLDLLLTNVGDKDLKEFTIFTGQNDNSVAYDDEGEQYGRYRLYLSFGGRALSGQHGEDFIRFPLLSNVPLKLKIQIEGMSEASTQFTRIKLGGYCNEFSFEGDKSITLFNVPITKDGDE